jgi:hypothetical protein
MADNRVRMTITGEGRDAEQALQGVERRMRSVQRETEQTRRGFDSLNRVGQTTMQHFRRMGLAIGGLTAAGGGLAYLGTQALRTAADVEKMAETAGVSVEAWQELEHAASEYNIQQQALMDGLKELSLRADEFVQTGAGPAREAFERLGFSQSELNRMLDDTPALLQEIVARLQDMDRAARIRISDEIFGGTGGEQFVRLVNGGAGALARMRREAHELGLVIDEDLVRNAESAREELDTLTRVLRAQLTSAVAELAPDISRIATDMTTWVGANKEFLTQEIPDKIRDTASAIGSVVEQLANVPDWAKYGGAGWLVGGRYGALAGGAFGAGTELSNITGGNFEGYQSMEEGLRTRLQELRSEREQAANRLGQLPDEDNPRIRQIRQRTEERLRHLDRQIDRYELQLQRQVRDRAAFAPPYGVGPGYEPPARGGGGGGTAGGGVSEADLMPIAELFPPFTGPSDAARRMADLRAPGQPGYMIPGEQAVGNVDAALFAVREAMREQTTATEEETRRTFDYMEAMSRRTAERMQDNFGDFFFNAMTGRLDSLSDYFSSFANSILRTWSDLQAQMLTRNLFGGEFMQGDSGSMGGLFGSVAGLFSGGGSGMFPVGSFMEWGSPSFMPRAAGGPVDPHSTYLVGERGPELLHMGRNSGNITPNHELRGEDRPVSLNLTIVAADAKSFSDMARRNPQAIIGPIKEALNYGDLDLRSAIRSA